jgi:GDP-D-mannose 3',5'-epimerase
MKKVLVCGAGVSCRTSDNKLIKEILSWEPQDMLEQGLAQTYKWINNQLGNES